MKSTSILAFFKKIIILLKHKHLLFLSQLPSEKHWDINRKNKNTTITMLAFNIESPLFCPSRYKILLSAFKHFPVYLVELVGVPHRELSISPASKLEPSISLLFRWWQCAWPISLSPCNQQCWIRESWNLLSQQKPFIFRRLISLFSAVTASVVMLLLVVFSLSDFVHW